MCKHKHLNTNIQIQWNENTTRYTAQSINLYISTYIFYYHFLLLGLSSTERANKHIHTKQSLPPLLSRHQDDHGGVMWRGCVEPSGLRDWRSAFIFQRLGWNTRPAQVSRKTERAKWKEREAERWGKTKADRSRKRQRDKLYDKAMNFLTLNIMFLCSCQNFLFHITDHY